MVKKTILDPNTAHLLIDAENCFKIDLTTGVDKTSKEIKVEAKIDGEYKNDLLLRIEEEDVLTKISAGFHPSFMEPNDKLSAHKVISISLKIQIPEQMRVSLFGTNCNVYVSGAYDDLKVSLDDGVCKLDNVSKNANVVTRSGDIYVSSSGATVKAKNGFGSISHNLIPHGDDFFRLSTVTGNIYLSKTE